MLEMKSWRVLGLLCAISLACTAPEIHHSDPPELGLELNALPPTEVGAPLALHLPVPSTYAVSATGLPPGLRVNQNVVEGTATAAGVFSPRFSFVAPDGQTLERTVTLTVASALNVSTPPLAVADVGAQAGATLEVSGGVPPYAWSLPDGLPPGFFFDHGRVTGTRRYGTDVSVTVRATDALGVSRDASASFNFALPLEFRSKLKPLWNVHRRYGYEHDAEPPSLEIWGGAGEITLGLAEGALPPGLSFVPGYAGALLVGTPEAAGVFPFRMEAEDAKGRTASFSYTITILNSFQPVAQATWVPDGVIGLPYTLELRVQAGTGPFTWTASALPAGLSLDPAGKVTGTPTELPEVPPVFTVTDANGQTDSVTLGWLRDPLVVTFSPLSDPYVGVPYSAPVSSNLEARHTLSGDAPPGLALTPSGDEAALAGTPTQAGTYAVRLSSEDTGEPAQHTSSSRVLHVRRPPVLAGPSLPQALEGAAYVASLQAEGGKAPYAFSLPEGGLAPGLLLSSDGTISGTPTASGTYDLEVRVEDANGVVTTSSIPLEVEPTLAITRGGTLLLQVGDAPPPLQASGQQGTLTWTVTSGALPVGLTLGADGSFGGTAETAGEATVGVSAQDSAAPGVVSSQRLRIRVVPPLVFTSSDLPAGSVGWPYAEVLGVQGGGGPLQFAVTAGSLPAGVTLDPEGGLSGTPTGSGTSTFTVQVSDASGQSVSQAYTLTVTPPLTLVSAALPDRLLNATDPYQFQFEASGGGGGQTFALVADPENGLPTGMTLTSDGLLSGSPVYTGRTTFELAVTDANGAVAWGTYSLWVETAPWLF